MLIPPYRYYQGQIIINVLWWEYKTLYSVAQSNEVFASDWRRLRGSTRQDLEGELSDPARQHPGPHQP